MDHQTDNYCTVTLPRATGMEEDFVFVGLNGKGYTVRRGEPVRVPRPVYDVLREALRQRRRQEDYIRARQEDAARSAADLPNGALLN